MLRMHASAVRRMGWLGNATSVNVSPTTTVVPTDTAHWTYVGSSPTGQNVFQRSDGSLVVGNGAGQYVLANPPSACTPAPIWYENNGDGTYTRYIYEQSSCGGAVISAAEWSAETGQSSSGATGSAAQGSAAAVTPSGQAISTQTALAVTLVNINNLAPGVYQCTFSDGSKNYCDGDGNPISYTPPATTPSITPAQGLPISSVAPSVVTQPPIPAFLGPPVPAPAVQGTPVPTVTASNQPINTAAPAASSPGVLSDVTNLLQGTVFGLPTWMLLAGAGVALFMLSDSSPTPRHRR